MNKYLSDIDLKLASFQCIRKELEHIYRKKLNKTPIYYGARSKSQTRMFWSRDWEYPWAIINSGVKTGDKVLDCGCDNSPLLPFLASHGCECYGVDQDPFGKIDLPAYYVELLADLFKALFKGVRGRFSDDDRGLAIAFLKESVRPFRWINRIRIREMDPNSVGYKVHFFKESMENMHFERETFDKVFCISVIEHLPVEVAFKSMKEMARVLKKGGLLVMTVDDDGTHVNPRLAGRFEELIEASGLELFGGSDFKKPSPEDVPGEYNVVGFILVKS